MRPKKINVRPANELESKRGGIVVWVYGRKVQVQLIFEDFPSVEDCINEAVLAWYHARDRL